MLISHMLEDDEINFYGLCPRPLVTKGLRRHQISPKQDFEVFKQVKTI